MTNNYYIIENEQQAGPFSKSDLASRHISSETLVWRPGLNDWVKASQLEELADIIAIETGYQDLNTGADNRWFAMINGRQEGPYTIETLISMGLNPETPVWRSGMPDWTNASYVPEIMRRFSATPPPHNGGYPRADYGRNPGFGGYNQGGYNQGGYNQGGYNNNGWQRPQGVINWLPWAIIATIIALPTSCIGAIFGIIAIINANKANTLYQQGYPEYADSANKTAKTMTIITAGLIALGIIGSLFVVKNGWPI